MRKGGRRCNKERKEKGNGNEESHVPSPWLSLPVVILVAFPLVVGVHLGWQTRRARDRLEPSIYFSREYMHLIFTETCDERPRIETLETTHGDYHHHHHYQQNHHHHHHHLHLILFLYFIHRVDSIVTHLKFQLHILPSFDINICNHSCTKAAIPSFTENIET